MECSYMSYFTNIIPDDVATNEITDSTMVAMKKGQQSTNLFNDRLLILKMTVQGQARKIHFSV